ncbi:unnamed protein product [Fraxinus pennsylvanica]|uniref:Uncharacterized protein n=1 Tax=Fraxinus pennsylvanica TaxID=56036 RepID=A0AAD2E9E2_9LAMI|nr:unnamed protein product [Fraxinus pennsylvanica]
MSFRLLKTWKATSSSLCFSVQGFFGAEVNYGLRSGKPSDLHKKERHCCVCVDFMQYLSCITGLSSQSILIEYVARKLLKGPELSVILYPYGSSLHEQWDKLPFDMESDDLFGTANQFLPNTAGTVSHPHTSALSQCCPFGILSSS